MKAFVMKPEEQAAMQRAEKSFLWWRESMPAGDKARLSKLGDAARAFLSAWDEARPDGRQSPELSILLAHMQESEFMRMPKSAYVEQLDAAQEVLLVMERSCRALVHGGAPVSEHVRRWIACAASAWHEAGLTPSDSERGRFKQALDAYRGHPSIPVVSQATLTRALADWRKGV